MACFSQPAPRRSRLPPTLEIALVSAAASIIADVIFPIVSFVLEMCLHILLASIRPWRYLLSSAFRANTNARYANVHPALKWWHLLWGSFLLVASIGVVVGLLCLLSPTKAESEPPPGARQQTVEKIEQVVIDKLKKHQESKQ